jgi:hypothetical protein
MLPASTWICSFQTPESPNGLRIIPTLSKLSVYESKACPNKKFVGAGVSASVPELVSNAGSVEFVGTRILLDDFIPDDFGEISDHGFALSEFSTRQA